MRNAFHFVRLLLVLTALIATVNAQTGRGSLTGTVQDARGSVVKDATVKITQQGTGTTRQAGTNASGIYRFDGVFLRQSRHRTSIPDGPLG